MFYDNLKRICDEKGLRITPTVLECGGTRGSIGGWKKGAYPNSKILLNLSVRLNVSCEYLLTGNDTHQASLIEMNNQPLTESESDMLDSFRRLTPHQQCKLIVRAEDMVEENLRVNLKENVG